MRAQLKPILYLCWLIFAMALFSGCAARGPVLIQNSMDDFNALKNSKVAIAFFAPDKRLEFGEQTYLVLGYSLKESYRAYEGIWDPMPALKEKVLDEMKMKYRIIPINLEEIMQPEAFSAMRQSRERVYNLNRIKGTPDGGAGRTSWNDEANLWRHNKFLLTKLPGDIITELKAINIDYLLEVYLASITYKSLTHVDSVICHFVTYSRLNRILDGSLIWVNQAGGFTKIKGVKALRDLEKDNLVLLKQGYNEAVSRGEVLTGFAP